MSTPRCYMPVSLEKKGHICVGLTDRYALSLPSKQTPATQSCQDMCSAETPLVSVSL